MKQCFVYGKNINILYNYDTNFYHVIKSSIELVLKLHDRFGLYVILMRIGNQKATIKNKIRAIEQKFVLDLVKYNSATNSITF